MLLQKIYLIKSKEDNYYKIGRATDVSQRLASLETGTPFDLELVFSQEVNDAVKVEQDLHLMFSSKRVKGEWFRLTPQDAEVIKDYIINFKNRFLHQQNTPYKHRHIPKRDFIQRTSSFDFTEPAVITNRSVPQYVVTSVTNEGSINKALNMLSELHTDMIAGQGTHNHSIGAINMASAMYERQNDPVAKIDAIKEVAKIKAEEGGVIHEKHTHK